MKRPEPPRDPLEFRFCDPIPAVARHLHELHGRRFVPHQEELQRLRSTRGALRRITLGASSNEVFSALKKCLPFASGMIISFTSGDPTNILARTYGVTDVFAGAVMAWQGPPDPTPHLVAKVPAGTAYHITHASPEWYLRRAPIVEALYPRYGVDLFTDLIVSHTPGNGDIHHRVITLFHEAAGKRRRDSERTFRDCRLLALLRDDLACALDRVRAPLTWGEDLFSQTERCTGLVAVGFDGRILEANARAAELTASYGQRRGLGEFVRFILSRSDQGTKRLLLRHPGEPKSLELFVHRVLGDAHGLPGEFFLVRMNELAAGHVVWVGHPALESLPPRQREALRLLLEHGWSSKEIAREMRISDSTARKHLSFAYRALGVNSDRESLARLSWRESEASESTGLPAGRSGAPTDTGATPCPAAARAPTGRVPS